VQLHATQGSAQTGHDWRDYPTGQGAARRWNQGENPGGKTGQYQGNHLVEIKPQGRPRNQGRLYQGPEIPLRDGDVRGNQAGAAGTTGQGSQGARQRVNSPPGAGGPPGNFHTFFTG